MVLIFFLDGVGLGQADPAINPFVTARMPRLTALFGAGWFLQGQGRLQTERATLIPTDANLGVAGRPQSATGQAAILTGKNAPQLTGGHYGPKPTPALADLISRHNIFRKVTAAGKKAALLTPYPDRYFEHINSGRRLFSAMPLAATSAGLPLLTADDLREGRAVSPDFTGEGWRDHLDYDDIPILTLYDAGRRIALLARQYDFSFFEHWLTDRAGHRGSLAQAAAHLERLDQVLGSLLDHWDDDAGLLVITSDHGNIEDKSRRGHTRNPVPTILVGQQHQTLAPLISDISDIFKITVRYLWPGPENVNSS